MPGNRISRFKIKAVRRNYLDKTLTRIALSRMLAISLPSIDVHTKAFIALGKTHPKQAANINFFPPQPKKQYPPTARLLEMQAVLPGLIAGLTSDKASVPALFGGYREACPRGYHYNTFRKRFTAWHKTSRICVFTHQKVTAIPDEDRRVLQSWLAGNDLQAWRHATAITDSFDGVLMVRIAEKLQLSYPSILTYIKKYKAGGLAGLKRKYGGANQHWVVARAEKKANLMKLIHQSPHLHGLNRTSWRLKDLSKVYYDLYGVNVSTSSIALYFRQEGVGFKKAKLLLTSPDPKFREKLDLVKTILSALKPTERFFSIDEYGPFSIKMKVGWSYTKLDHPKTVKQFQKSKGWAICTAALELATNQVTHFYSRKKDTDEMIIMIDLLVQQYATNTKLYLSWDAASWHNSVKLKAHIAQINALADGNLNTTPYVELAPLPSSAQFLNVIESVFSGLAKAVMHNSDYHSVGECKAAISTYFTERNAYFIKYPKQAGKTIWGKELVKPVFNEANNCKDTINTLGKRANVLKAPRDSVH